MDRILVTPRSLTSSPPPALDRLRDAGFDLVFSTPGATPTEAELLRLVPGCVGWLAGVEPVSESVVAAADRLRIISRNGSGADNLPASALRARGIRVARAMGANATGIAELTVGLILSACRHIPETSTGIRAGGWPRLVGREVEGTTVGIVGLGAIGRRVARVLARLPRGAIVVNTARAGFVDAPGLLAALDGGRIEAYATDVFATEPPAGDPLAAHPRVLATSHIGALTEGSVTRATEAAVENLLLALRAPAHAPG
ncbi:D-3-phosphoglycerate dehydrogenase [Rubellimicrobium mesophilum DSM 19309]|uniref:D-3-phosphoglycerate dehydrogenase n=1 Tax=Rubellimicrobium mesophilum DSM 19309 TaxID=442562 RepID=A0A017HKI9_9RHOB|nr:NAD(P)-dependent oxidoreductase [Rubellimicrobium mesophilum]EYD74294.1 D-3-phosphoglycerate dehydrogenase [Rubellimicrobium mesophilum DSM 19309]